ncbi:PREDICTED: uncharacterized protein LOC102813122 [Chrysochloris asiatica]|uniref:Uncharacterized protein LOC102813122 n=1 Tax=Chrysochloris asiatica TaxID=185453 RepID=A0A9B0WKG0_CHRAS|nr:PREDICTED: uncharacterized protein LOC102813122 [Chrysochloris asiatica]
MAALPSVPYNPSQYTLKGVLCASETSYSISFLGIDAHGVDSIHVFVTFLWLCLLFWLGPVKARTLGYYSHNPVLGDQSHPKLDESSCKDIANALSLVNMILGIFSIFCSFYRKSHCASWLLLISFLLDMAVGTMTRQLSICCRSGAELNDFAVFTTFGLASALLLGVDGPLSGLLAIMYVLATSFRLCFFTTGVPLIYKGLPCPYASCVLASTSLLTKGNTFILCCVASLMILFMMDQTYYPHEEILESKNWKKMVYLGGVIMLFLSPFSLTPFYCLMWSISYIFFPDSLWGKTTCLRLRHRRNETALPTSQHVGQALP